MTKARLALAIVALACAVAFQVRSGGAAEEPQWTGFLIGFNGNYSAFQNKMYGPSMGPNSAGLVYNYVYTNPNLQASNYNKILVDPVKVYLSHDASSNQIDPEALVQLVNYFHTKLVYEVSNSGYKVALGPGPKTMRMRVAITDLVPTNSVGAEATTLIPQLRLLSAGAQLAMGKSPFFMGQIAIEAELIDSQSNQVIAALASKKAGDRWSPQAAASTWGQVKLAMDGWADRLKLFLNRAKGINQAKDD